MKKIYKNKLVRDHIPELLENAGLSYAVSQLSDEKYLETLHQKLREEVDELFLANSDDWIEELADLMEVVDALLHAKGISKEKLISKQKKKRLERGNFSKKIFLEYILSNDTTEKKTETDCLFCQLSTGEYKREILFNHPTHFVCEDKYPVSPGHILLIPKEHFTDWFDTPKNVQQDIMQSLEEMKKNLDKTLQPDGYNVGFNCGKAAGQTVFHLHLHLIPRYHNDIADPTGGVRGVIPKKRIYKK